MLDDIQQRIDATLIRWY